MADQPHEMRDRLGEFAAWFRRRRSEDPLVLALRQLHCRRGYSMRRCLVVGATILAIVTGVAVAAAGLFAARLTQGPVFISDLGPRIAAALDEKVGSGYAFTLGATSVEVTRTGLALGIKGLALRDAAGRPIIVAPKAKVSLDPMALLFGQFRPRRLDILDIDVRLSILPDGSVAVSAGNNPIIHVKPISAAGSNLRPASPQGPSTVAGTADAPMQQLAVALKRVLDRVTTADGPLGSLERVGIARGKLIFDDRTRDVVTAFSGFKVAYRRTQNRVALRISADGPSGPWQVSGEVDRTPGDAHSFDLGLQNISFSQIALIAGWRDPGVYFTMPISSKFHFALDAHGNLAQASGQFDLGSGYFLIRNPDEVPMPIDEVVGGFRWNANARRIEFDPTELFSGQTHFEINTVLSAPRVAGQGWNIELVTSPGGVIGADRPGEMPIALQARLAGKLFTSQRKLAIESFTLSGPQVNFAMSGDVLWGSEADTRIKLAAAAGQVPMRQLVRIWPSFIAPPVHAWFLKHTQGGMLDKGTVRVDFTGADLAAMRAQKPIPADRVEVDFSLSHASASFLRGVPPLSALDGTGRVTGRTVDFTATGGQLDEGKGRLLTMTGGTLEVADTSIKPTPAVIKAHILGNLDSVADFLSRNAVKSIGGGLPIDTATVKGQVDAQVAVNLTIGKNVPPQDTWIEANATVSNFSVDKLFGKEKLEQGTLTVDFDRSALTAQGTGRLFGAPATIALRKPPSGATVADISVTLDDAARAKLGWNFGPALTGPIGAHFESALGQGTTSRSQVELDLTHADIKDLVPGYVKPAGHSAKATFTVTSSPQGIRIDPLVFDGGTASARGSAEFGANGRFVSARLSSVRLSRGDDMNVDIDEVKGVTRVTVRGASVDARPFLAMVRNAGDGAPDTAHQGDFDLDFKSPLVVGNNKQSMTGVELDLSRRGGVFRQFKLVGRLGGETVRGTTVRPRDGSPSVIALTTNDAGALLAFTDLYRRMEGGGLRLFARLDDGRIAGQLVVHNFILHDEPAIRQLVTEGVPRRDRQGDVVTWKIDPTAARFTKLSVNFVRTGGRLEIRDGLMFSPQIGTKLDGWLDYAHNQVNMTGTFVPVYGINDLFSQIPLFGPILGGGAHEGLFAVNFRITGPASAPVLTINPLSAIAPGFLRKIFGAIDFGADQSPPADPNAPLSLAPAR